MVLRGARRAVRPVVRPLHGATKRVGFVRDGMSPATGAGPPLPGSCTNVFELGRLDRLAGPHSVPCPCPVLPAFWESYFTLLPAAAAFTVYGCILLPASSCPPLLWLPGL